MPQVGEGASVAVDSDGNAQLHSCDWKNCKGQHPSAISYPGGGTVDRNGSYADDWVAADLEPWKKYGDGTDSRATLQDYQREVSAQYAFTAAALKHPAYHTQKHHLISVKLFTNVPTLSHDVKLVSYDVNAKENGVCLPSFIVDIVRHDLQCHRGNHPNNLYYDKISPLLREKEKLFATYCATDIACTAEPQKRVVDDLNRLSQRIEGQLRAWKWFLRSDAVAERVASKKILHDRTTP